MPEYVRVRDKATGHHYSITRARFERSPDLFAELKQDAAHPNGQPLPPKYKTTVSAETEKKASQTTAATTTEKEK